MWVEACWGSWSLQLTHTTGVYVPLYHRCLNWNFGHIVTQLCERRRKIIRNQTGNQSLLVFLAFLVPGLDGTKPFWTRTRRENPVPKLHNQFLSWSHHQNIVETATIQYPSHFVSVIPRAASCLAYEILYNFTELEEKPTLKPIVVQWCPPSRQLCLLVFPICTTSFEQH